MPITYESRPVLRMASDHVRGTFKIWVESPDGQEHCHSVKPEVFGDILRRMLEETDDA